MSITSAESRIEARDSVSRAMVVELLNDCADKLTTRARWISERSAGVPDLGHELTAALLLREVLLDWVNGCYEEEGEIPIVGALISQIPSGTFISEREPAPSPEAAPEAEPEPKPKPRAVTKPKARAA